VSNRYLYLTISGSGLSLLGYSGLQDIDPVYCMPVSVIERLGLKKRYQLLPKNLADAANTTETNGNVNSLAHPALPKTQPSSSLDVPALAPALPVLQNGITA
jgi:hypothetical protein